MDENRSRWAIIKEKIGSLEPRQILIPLIILIVLIGVIVGISNYSKNKEANTPPQLEVTSPQQQGTPTESDKAQINGQTDPNATVTVNDKEVPVAPSGSFNTEIPLNEGDNNIRISAVSEAGISSSYNLSINRAAKIAESPTAGADLSKSGPETLFIPEISALSLAVVGWRASKKKLTNTRKKIAQ